MVFALSIATKGFWPISAIIQPAYLPLNGIVTTNILNGTVKIS